MDTLKDLENDTSYQNILETPEQDHMEMNMSSLLGNSTMAGFMENPVKMPEPVQNKMESTFGTSLNDLQLFSSSKMNNSPMDALASGNTVSVASDKLDFNSGHGQELLGHEISHVVSQAKGESAGKSGLYYNPMQEKRADQDGSRAAAMAMPMQAKENVASSSGMNINLKKNKGAMQPFFSWKGVGLVLEGIFTLGIGPLIRWNYRKNHKKRMTRAAERRKAEDLQVNKLHSEEDALEAAKVIAEQAEATGAGEELEKDLQSAMENPLGNELVQETGESSEQEKPEVPIRRDMIPPISFEARDGQDPDLPPALELMVMEGGARTGKTFTNFKTGHAFVALRYSRFNKISQKKERYRTVFGLSARGKSTAAKGMSGLFLRATLPAELSNDSGMTPTIGKRYDIDNERVNKALVTAEEYPKGGYNLISRNCTTFARDVAMSIGFHEDALFKQAEWDIGFLGMFMPTLQSLFSVADEFAYDQIAKEKDVTPEERLRFLNSTKAKDDADFEGYTPGELGKRMWNSSNGSFFSQSHRAADEGTRQQHIKSLDEIGGNEILKRIDELQKKEIQRNKEREEEIKGQAEVLRSMCMLLNRIHDDVGKARNLPEYLRFDDEIYRGVAGNNIMPLKNTADRWVKQHKEEFFYLPFAAIDVLGELENFEYTIGMDLAKNDKANLSMNRYESEANKKQVEGTSIVERLSASKNGEDPIKYAQRRKRIKDLLILKRERSREEQEELERLMQESNDHEYVMDTLATTFRRNGGVRNEDWLFKGVASEYGIDTTGSIEQGQKLSEEQRLQYMLFRTQIKMDHSKVKELLLAREKTGNEEEREKLWQEIIGLYEDRLTIVFKRREFRKMVDALLAQAGGSETPNAIATVKEQTLSMLFNLFVSGDMRGVTKEMQMEHDDSYALVRRCKWNVVKTEAAAGAKQGSMLGELDALVSYVIDQNKE